MRLMSVWRRPDHGTDETAGQGRLSRARVSSHWTPGPIDVEETEHCSERRDLRSSGHVTSDRGWSTLIGIWLTA